MKKILLLALILFTQLTYATEIGKSVEASGKVDIFVANTINDGSIAKWAFTGLVEEALKPHSYLIYGSKKVNLKLRYVFWGEDKVRGEIFISKGDNTCPIVNSVPFYGINTGFGEFQIFASIDDLSASKEPIGIIREYGDTQTIILSKDLYFIGKSAKAYSSKKKNKFCLRGFAKGSDLSIKNKKIKN